ncbi:SDR family oxidoreductase [Nocardioides marmoribigeumensis]|uniref:NAD(P)-dependent dehydrogenase (Short-subunit alcohol dehydrogenase family) n=1 Tax=Nocardioides marmoribigeumensis TaxID=433649 RepID=A0ABU2BVV8_9ACTN|nr:SDR family oxidoreductase [Nocardioides marmoribigeumensis]MDR7362776.1 NAD(P)-dependent dehydrogenase (short-subunit alcohol dehydrogenase family) [Nocardioides marmoribigeumensis]
MSTSLHGKVVAITGGGRGIGAATATRLARAGAKVAIGDLDLDVAQATAERIGSGTLAVRLDVTDPKSFASFLDETEEKLGPVDVVVNNAGIMPLATLLEEDDASTHRILDLNVRSVIVASREAARRLVARGQGGHIVNIASTAGKTGLAGGATYCASKAAVIAFCEGIEMELAEHDVRVSCVMPGIVQTELSVGVPDLPAFKAVKPEDVADGIAAALEKPRLYVFVPRSAGPLLTSTTLLPRRAGLWLAKKMGADRVFTDASHDPSRASYESRAARTDMAAEESTR